MTSAEIRSMLEKLNGMVLERDLLARAENSLASGDEESARMDMAEAVREQIEYVKKYDTTGHLASQVQELRHVRTKLLKGVTWQACKKSFGRYCDIYREVAAEKDTIIVKTLGWCVRPFVWMASLAVNIDPVMADDFVHNTRLVTHVYAPFKTFIRLVCDREGRRHFGTMCKGVYRTGKETAKAVWAGAKKVCQMTASATVKVAKSGFEIAKQVSTCVVHSVKLAAQKTVSAGVKVAKGLLGRLFA